VNIVITFALVVIGILVVGLFLTAFSFPELYARIGKFLIRNIKRALGLPTLKPEQEEAKIKAKKLAPYQALVTKIEQIIPGQTLRYKIPETWGGSFVVIEINPQHLQNGRRYFLSIEDGIQGMPGGPKTFMYDSDEPLTLAKSIIDRNGESFVESGKESIITEKTTINA
jgi:hypothetical protein